ncbi:MAG: methionine synthase [Oscillospiraceae bacterium]|nr:methionine synthase [Oscillospiraceae bacterium]
MLKIESLNRSEALRYLACNDIESASSMPIIAECEKELLSVLAPKYVYRYFSINKNDDGIGLEGARLVLKGNDISSHLEGCCGVYLIAATIGPAADRLIRTQQITDMAKAVVTDAFASTAVEQVCAAAEEKIRSEDSDRFFTWRYAPGYGDFSIEIQKSFLDVLDAPRKIGLCTSPSRMLVPVKSVTSVMGVSDSPLPSRARGCITCNMREKCNFRKSGNHCGF